MRHTGREGERSCVPLPFMCEKKRERQVGVERERNPVQSHPKKEVRG